MTAWSNRGSRIAGVAMRNWPATEARGLVWGDWAWAGAGNATHKANANAGKANIARFDTIADMRNPRECLPDRFRLMGQNSRTSADTKRRSVSELSQRNENPREEALTCRRAHRSRCFWSQENRNTKRVQAVRQRAIGA